MCCATPAQPKIVTNKVILRYISSTWLCRKWLQKMIPDVYTCTTWNVCRQYHCTLHSHYLTFTTLVQYNFRVLHLHNLKSLSTVLLYTTLAQPDFHYISTTWFQSSTLVQPEIFIFMVKWDVSLDTRTSLFSLHWQNVIPMAFSLLLCFLTYTYFVLTIMSKLSRCQ